MTSQITLNVTLSGRDGNHTVEILLDGGVALAGLTIACMQAITLQHPHYSGQPIVAIRYDARANING